MKRHLTSAGASRMLGWRRKPTACCTRSGAVAGAGGALTVAAGESTCSVASMGAAGASQGLAGGESVDRSGVGTV
eukprot:scaffold2771_cov108-Isochrysis_galbana.AAC.4